MMSCNEEYYKNQMKQVEKIIWDERRQMHIKKKVYVSNFRKKHKKTEKEPTKVFFLSPEELEQKKKEIKEKIEAHEKGSGLW